MKKETKLLRNLILLALSSSPAYAGDLTISPSLKAEVIGSDNMRPTRDKGQESLASLLTPKLILNYDAARVGFNLDVQNTFVNFSNSRFENGEILTLSSDFHFTIFEKGPMLIGSRRIENRSRESLDVSLDNIDPYGAVRLQTDSLGLVYDVLNTDFYVKSSLIGEKRTSDDEVDLKEGYKLNLSAGNNYGAKNIFWSGNGILEEYEQLDRDYKYYNGEFIFGFLTNFYFNPYIRLFGEELSGNASSESNNNTESVGAGVKFQIGNDFNFYLTYNKDINENEERENTEYFSGKINWKPSERTSLDFAYGQRFFGDSYEFTFSQSLSKIKTDISYKESITAFDNYTSETKSLGFYFCPNGEIASYDDCLLPDSNNIDFDNYSLVELSDYIILKNKESSLSRQAKWETTFETSFGDLSVFANYNSDLRFTSKIKSQNIRTGVSLSRDINELSSIYMSLTYFDRKYDKDKIKESWQDSNYFLTKINYKRELNSTLTGEVNLQYVDIESTEIKDNYSESRISFSLTKEF